MPLLTQTKYAFLLLAGLNKVTPHHFPPLEMAIAKHNNRRAMQPKAARKKRGK